MQLWLLRHGRCESAADGPLTAAGKIEAQAAGERLASAGINHILSSPLLRALDTAAIVSRNLGDMPVHVWPELREGFSYNHRSASRAELAQHCPTAIFPPGFAEDGWDYGGDTLESVLARCADLLTRLQAEFAATNKILIIAHGGLINNLLNIILQIPAANPAWFELDYCAISRVRLLTDSEKEGWPLYPPVWAEILCVNDVSHLPNGKQESSRG